MPRLAAELFPVSPQEDLPTQQRILRDVFMHASAHSRTCNEISERVLRILRARDPEVPDRVTLDPQQALTLTEAIDFLQMARRDLWAKIAPAAVERVRVLANVNPDPRQEVIFDLEGRRLDAFLAPIFSEAGIAADLIGEAELKAGHSSVTSRKSA